MGKQGMLIACGYRAVVKWSGGILPGRGRRVISTTREGGGISSWVEMWERSFLCVVVWALARVGGDFRDQFCDAKLVGGVENEDLFRISDVLI